MIERLDFKGDHVSVKKVVDGVVHREAMPVSKCPETAICAEFVGDDFSVLLNDGVLQYGRESYACIDDLSQLPEKVQSAAGLIFTPEIKAEYIANLPRVPAKKQRQKVVYLPVMIANPEYDPKKPASPEQIQDTEEVIVPYEAYIDDSGVLQPAGERPEQRGKTYEQTVTHPDGTPVMEEYTDPNDLRIEYKGVQYPLDWDGAI